MMAARKMMAAWKVTMEIRVLGPLTCHVDGRSAVPSAGKPRKLLALLAVRRNQFVPVGDLVRELWDEDPPRSVKVTLQSYVARLRTLLGKRSGAGSDRLRTEHGGYRLTVERTNVDVGRFEDATDRGRAALLAGEFERAAQQFRAALDVWRGPAFADVHTGLLLGIHAARLAETRLATVEQLMESELWLGRHLEILRELTELIAENPYHENLHAQLMRALYRSARRHQALEVFHRLRGRLAEDLGLDPSPRMRHLHRAVLGDDPSLELPIDRSALLAGIAA
jgi:DNA-binding SARP family transcriptional activator